MYKPGLAVLLGLLVMSADARPSSNVSSHLNAVRKQIARVEAHQRLTESERQQQEHALEQSERDIGRLVEQTRALDAQAATLNAQLQVLEKRQVQLQQEDAAQTQALIREDRLVWQNVRHDYFRLLLNQQHPEKLARVLRDFRVLNDDRDIRLQSLRRNVAELLQSRQQAEQERDRLRALQQGLQQRHEALAQAKKHRQKALSLLRRQEQSDAQKLQRLQESEHRLSDLLLRLSRPAAVTPHAPASPTQPRPRSPGRGPLRPRRACARG